MGWVGGHEALYGRGWGVLAIAGHHPGAVRCLRTASQHGQVAAPPKTPKKVPKNPRTKLKLTVRSQRGPAMRRERVCHYASHPIDTDTLLMTSPGLVDRIAGRGRCRPSPPPRPPNPFAGNTWFRPPVCRAGDAACHPCPFSPPPLPPQTPCF